MRNWKNYDKYVQRCQNSESWIYFLSLVYEKILQETACTKAKISISRVMKIKMILNIISD